jgi:DNA replication protein DnaD
MEMDKQHIPNSAHGQTDPHKTGNRPKSLVEGTVKGLPIGREKVIVPPQQVYELAAIGCTDPDIARFFGVNENSLRYNFKTELRKGREDLKITLRRAMLKNAVNNMNVVMQIFLAKNLLSMSDNGMVNAEEPLPWTDEARVENPETQGEPDIEREQPEDSEPSE